MHLRSLGNALQLSAAAAVSFIFTTLNFRGFLNTTQCKCHPGTLPNSSHLWCSALFILLFLYPPKKINKSRANVLPYRPDSPVSREGDHKNCNKLLSTGRWYLMWWEEHNIWRIWSGQLSELPVHEFSHISGLCSACISLMAMYTHTCTHASALP